MVSQMSKILAVIGATGRQGSGLVSYILNEPVLSKQFKVRAITRNPDKPEAQALRQQGVEVVKGDVDDKASLVRALQGVHTLYAMTAATFAEGGREKELEQAKNIGEAAVEAKVDFIIFSTLPHVSEISGGKYTQVHHFDAKAEGEQYIRKLRIKSAFFSPSCFLQNFLSVWSPQPAGDGTYNIASIVDGDTRFPWLDAVGDSGKYLASILLHPEKYEGAVFHAGSEVRTLNDVAAAISKATGKTVRIQQIPEEVYRSFMTSTAMANDFVEMLYYIRDFGYHGPDNDELVKWAVENAHGKLTTVEEFFVKNSVKLE